MRPLKVILCVDRNPVALSVRCFQLETWHYRVLRASSCAEALETLEAALPGAIHLIVCAYEMPGVQGLLRRARELHPDSRSLVLSMTAKYGVSETSADVFLPQAAARVPAEVRERVKTLVARKRGPKKTKYLILEDGKDGEEVGILHPLRGRGPVHGCDRGDRRRPDVRDVREDAGSSAGGGARARTAAA